MPDILVRNVEDDVAKRMKEMAKAKGTSANKLAREALRVFFKPNPSRTWAEIDALRARIGPLDGDSTAMIREDRDNDEPYR
jgi:plasmid stability protein